MPRWKTPKIWEGRCWIIGGGPSVPVQFGIPQETIDDVVSGKLDVSAYSEWIKPALENDRVIAINSAYQIGSWVDAVFFGDAGWYLANRGTLLKWPGIKATCSPRFANKRGNEAEGIKFLGRDQKKREGISDNRSTVSWNKNSGAAAISLAAHFGATEIILLGFDMKSKPAPGGKPAFHFHNYYKNGKQPPFQRHLRGFNQIAQDAKRKGITILNACPDSAIECFKKVKISEVTKNVI